MTSFKDFMKRRQDASDAFVNGNVAPLLEISSQSQASIFPPNGKTISGADQVNETNSGNTKMFEPGSENSFEIMHMGESGNLAYWTGIQRSKIRMKGKAEPVPMALRITELFRQEGDEWKLFHRHADLLKS